jgi:esterase
MIHANKIGEGFPLIIIHGFMGMGDNWKTLGQQFALQNFQVHMLDMRNHGKSFHSDEFNYAVMVQDVIDYTKSQKITKCHIIGHSMGGKIAMLLATSYSYLIDKLIVADISPRYYAPHHQKILEALNAVDFSVKPSRKDVENILNNFISDFGTKQFLLKNLYWQTPEQLAFRFNLQSFNKNIENIGEALPVDKIFSKETLFLAGGNSDYITKQDFVIIKHHFPISDVVYIPNAGHWLHAEQPILFYNEVIRFLQ